MGPGFQDHFATVAGAYADFRPTYPPALFAWLASQTPRHHLAWDCGAGSGQASLALTRHFHQVVATDASAAQISRITPHPAMVCRVAPAAASGLADHAVDLVVVAQALHWFDLPRFYAEVYRVLKPDGLVAVWCYGTLHVEGEAVNALVQAFYHQEVGPCWPPERQHVENGYRDLPFPFAEISPPAWTMAMPWTLPQLLGYFQSWSATAAYIQRHGVNPVEDLADRLHPLWGSPDQLRWVRWPLSMRAGHPLTT